MCQACTDVESRKNKGPVSAVMLVSDSKVAGIEAQKAMAILVKAVGKAAVQKLLDNA